MIRFLHPNEFEGERFSPFETRVDPIRSMGIGKVFQFAERSVSGIELQFHRIRFHGIEIHCNTLPSQTLH